MGLGTDPIDFVLGFYQWAIDSMSSTINLDHTFESNSYQRANACKQTSQNTVAHDSVAAVAGAGSAGTGDQEGADGSHGRLVL